MLDAEPQIFSINTLATICRCSELVFSSAGDETLVGSSSKLKSLEVIISLSTTFCSVSLR
jgi:hypothetical protein